MGYEVCGPGRLSIAGGCLVVLVKTTRGSQHTHTPNGLETSQGLGAWAVGPQRTGRQGET